MNWLKNRWRSVSLQILAVAVLPLALLSLLIAIGSLSLHRQAMRNLVGERDERATQAAAAAMTEQITFRLTAVRSLAHQANSSNGPTHALADAAHFLPNFEGGLALFDTNANLIGGNGDVALWQSPTVKATVAALIQDANEQPFTTIAHPQTEAWLTLVMSHTAAEGDAIVAIGAFSPTNLANSTLTALFGNEAMSAAFLVDANGRLLHQIGSLPYHHGPSSTHPGIAEALQGNSGTLFLDDTNPEHVVAYSPVQPTGWALIIEEPWESVSDPLLEATKFAPFLLLPALLITLLTLWFGFRQIMQPLQQLEQQATALGVGNYAAIEESVGGISEIRSLQAELVQMAHKVKAAQQNLRGYLSAVTAGQEEERRRLARDLHDDTIQSLIALNQRIQLAQMKRSANLTGKTEVTLNEMQQMVAQIIDDLRRLTHALRPIYLEDLGLLPAISMLAQETELGGALSITFQTIGTARRLPPNVELALYRIAQEALSNVTRHAKATNAVLTLAFLANSLKLTIHDNGQGFVVSDFGTTQNGHFGLLSIQERSELIGATFHLLSEPGKGTIVSVQLPIGALA